MSSAQDRLNSFINGLTPEQRVQYASRINKIQDDINAKNIRQRPRADFITPRATSSYDYSNEYENATANPYGLPPAPKIRPTQEDFTQHFAPTTQSPQTQAPATQAPATQAQAPASQAEKRAASIASDLFSGKSPEAILKQQVEDVSNLPDDPSGNKDDSRAKGVLLANAILPSHDKLTNAEVEKAHLLKASKIYDQTQNMDAVKEYLRSKGMSDYEIDEDLSTRDALVTKSPEGTVEVSWRGTNKASLSDWRANAATLANSQTDNKKFKDGKNLYEAVKNKYTEAPIEVNGFSLGGAVALHVGTFYDAPATVFNPHISVQPSTLDPKADTKIIRTTTDPVSLGLALTKQGNKVEVKTLNPTEHSFSPFKSHLLDNFTDTESTRPADNAANIHLKNILDSGAKAAQGVLLDASEENMDSGKTFTEHLVKFNGGSGGKRDTVLDAEGNHVLSKGLNVESGMVRAWKDVGGTFTEGEVNSLLDDKEGIPIDKDQPATEERHQELMDKISEIHDTETDVGMNVQDRKDYVNSSKEDRADYVAEQVESQQASIDHLNEFGENATVAAPKLMDNFKSAMNPTNLARGLISGYLAKKAMAGIDPEKKMSEFTSTGVEGAVSGAVTWFGSAALGLGGTAFIPEVLGGAAAYEAQNYSKQGISYLEDKAFGDGAGDSEVGKDAADILSSATGGAVAGGLLGGVPGALIGAGVGATSSAAVIAQGFAKKGVDYIEDKISSGESKTELGGDVSTTIADAGVGAAIGTAIAGPAGTLIGAGLGTLAGIGTSLYHHFF
jgi:hypothetical protein